MQILVKICAHLLNIQNSQLIKIEKLVYFQTFIYLCKNFQKKKEKETIN